MPVVCVHRNTPVANVRLGEAFLRAFDNTSAFLEGRKMGPAAGTWYQNSEIYHPLGRTTENEKTEFTVAHTDTRCTPVTCAVTIDMASVTIFRLGKSQLSKHIKVGNSSGGTLSISHKG